MKKLLIAFSAALAFGFGMADAAVPQGGYFLDKDGVPLTEAQKTPPSVKKSAMAPLSGDVLVAMESLPYSSSAIILVTVNEDGFPENPVVSQSSGSVILDAYAAESVKDWIFNPSMLGEKAVSSQVSVPVRFMSMKIVTSATPLNQPMKETSDAVRGAAAKNNHPVIYVSVYIRADGTLEGPPKAVENTNLSKSDFKILAKYAEDCVKDWTFSPALNPEGDPIPEETEIPVQL